MEKHQEKILELLDSHGARLFGLLVKLTLREDVAGELMQELFIKLNKSRSFDKYDHPYTYAYRAALNLAFSWRRRPRIKIESLDESKVAAPESMNPLGAIIRQEQLEQTLDAMGRLSDLGREVLILRYIEQETHEQIGRRLNKKPQHVRSVCSKAVAQLRRFLNNETQTPQEKEGYDVKN